MVVNDQVDEGSAAKAKAWVDENRVLVEEAYQRFINEGVWPDVSSLQRRFDRAGIEIEVQKAVDAKPRTSWETRLLHTDRLTLQLRHLMWVDDAKFLVTVCVRAMQRAVESYLSDTDQPAVTSDGRLVEWPSDPDGNLRLRAFEILTFEHPSPFGGSSRTGTSWRIEVNAQFVRRFRNVATATDFVARQDEIRADMSKENLGFAPPVLLTTHAPGVLEDDALEEEPLAEIENPSVAGAVDTEILEEDDSEPEPRIFLSWSGDMSRAVARAFVSIFKRRLKGVDVFFSPTSIDPGDDPSDRLYDDGLLRARALVVVVTPDGAGSPFAIWETAAAWGQGKLVIPVFVDIEPRVVPGPLTTKVQGVDIHDRERVDRAIELLAATFGVGDVSSLTDKEFETLEAAVQTAAADPLTEWPTPSFEATGTANIEVTGTAKGTWTPASEDPVLTESPYLVVTTKSYSVVPDGWTRQVEIENFGNGAAIQCGVVCFGDYGSWGFERGFHLRPRAVIATDVSSSQIAPVVDGLLDLSPSSEPRGDPLGRVAVLCRDTHSNCWRFIEGFEPEHWRSADPAAPPWVRSRFFGWPSEGTS